MHVYIIDNYDSFTYNLYQFFGEVLTSAKQRGDIDSFELTVKRNDEVSLEDIQSTNPDRLVISPGPGSPDDKAYFGVCLEVIQTLGKTLPTLGVCLGMQGIVHAFGGKIIRAPLPMHGKVSDIDHNAAGIFNKAPHPLTVMRYHSLVASNKTMPDCFEITAIASDHPLPDFNQSMNEQTAEIMAVQHKEYPITGIQFHPESYATEGGKELLRNFLFNQ
ncbi:MAG: aminodeoxychorismate/anthranilate synthase component II [Cellvibrionales bacterium]|nr:aminodeoxychorismate/anthranilate synthase component II [Cellvibrionales bacterium]